MKPRQGLQLQHENVPAYPMMAPLQPAAPTRFARAGAYGSDIPDAVCSGVAVQPLPPPPLPTPVPKGMCAICSRVVNSHHVRTKNAQGQYVHGECAAKTPGMEPPPPDAGMMQQGRHAVVANINGENIL